MKFGLPQAANGKLFFIGLAAVLGPWSLYLFTLNRAAKRLKEAERDNEIVKKKAIVEDTTETSPTKSSISEKEDKRRKILIIYGTCTGTARRLALDLSKKFGSVFSADDVAITVVDAKDYDEFTLDLEDIVLFICSTWTDGVAPETAQRLVESLKDYASDFRVSKSHLSKLKFAVFGLGGSDYSVHFCRAAKDINDCFTELGATPLLPLSLGDDSEELIDKYNKWSERATKKIKATLAGIELKPIVNKNYYESHINPKPVDEKKKSLSAAAAAAATTTAAAAAVPFPSTPLVATVTSTTTSTVTATPTSASTTAPEHAEKNVPKEASGTTNQDQNVAINTKPKKAKFQKNVGKGKISKANAFQIQQKLVKEEAKAPVVSTVRTDTSTIAVTRSASSCASDNSDSACCQSNEQKGKQSTGCCSSNGVQNKENIENIIVLDGNNKLGLDAEDDEEEEDRINNEYVQQDEDEDDEGSDSGFDEEADGDLLDLEDIGAAMKRQKSKEKKEKDAADRQAARDGGREMVTKLQRRALTKEGYRIIGTHSAVKLCRWTKNQMRGRGGCYKHTFYGITSYQCMEATPSLACANKCVFCWRHHKNPVGTEWRWKTDDPNLIVSEAVDLHRAMINEMRGVPGVQPERLADAFNVKHCALSLVGEPIMYPRINELLKALHDRKISTFLVTNAQFPDSIRDLEPITQLYVSVDASTRDSLKAIDRPLFKDFWERFLESLRLMAEKKQRTVYRLTLVKSWNMEEADSYVELIEKGQPDFIEIKSVTYCGKSDASSLTMENVPWHHECCQFSEAIANRLAERGNSARYSIATEHEHSCCVLLAREDKFKVNGVWHTWIDYDKYHSLIGDFYASGGVKTFTSEDYMAVTPDWALYKSAEHGFDPTESRWKRNKAGALVAIEYKSSDSGCG